MKTTTSTKTKITKAPKAATQKGACPEHPVPYLGCPDCEVEAARQRQIKADLTKLKAGDQKRKASLKAAKATRATPEKSAEVVRPAEPKATKAPTTARVAKEPKVAGTSKKDQVLALISRRNGATLDEIMTATGWQKHTVRGFIAILGRESTEIESSKSEAGARTYRA